MEQNTRQISETSNKVDVRTDIFEKIPEEVTDDKVRQDIAKLKETSQTNKLSDKPTHKQMTVAEIDSEIQKVKDTLQHEHRTMNEKLELYDRYIREGKERIAKAKDHMEKQSIKLLQEFGGDTKESLTLQIKQLKCQISEIQDKIDNGEYSDVSDNPEYTKRLNEIVSKYNHIIADTQDRWFDWVDQRRAHYIEGKPYKNKPIPKRAHCYLPTIAELNQKLADLETQRENMIKVQREIKNKLPEPKKEIKKSYLDDMSADEKEHIKLLDENDDLDDIMESDDDDYDMKVRRLLEDTIK